MRALPRLRREPSVAPPTTAPEVVHEVLDAPGEQLDDATRDEMESRFGYDFGSVRVHSDERAAQSAEAVEAAAWTVGDDVAFASGLYRPNSSAGRELLAHELAHVVEGEDRRTDSSVTLGRTDDPAERRAEARAAGPGSGRPRSRPSRAPGRRTRGGVLRRTTFGALLGGGIGAVGGAILGGLLGGPIGALVGGLVGFVAGAIVGEVASTKSRSLTQPDIDYAKDIYLDSIDYSQITITRDSVLALGAPRTIGNTIHLKSVWDGKDVFVGDTLELTDFGRELLIHEMAHVWQYQNGGLAYIPESLIAQLKAAVSGGDRGGAYDWRAAHAAGIPWEDWNPEQQAGAVERYNVLLRRSKAKDPTMTVEELNELSILLKYVEKVQRREGAPTYEQPELGSFP
jgi:Domain of unknown function (DUF4157)